MNGKKLAPQFLPPARPWLRTSRRRFRVLVIDDEADSRLLISHEFDVIEKPLSRDAIIRLIGRQASESSRLMLVKEHPARLLMVG